VAELCGMNDVRRSTIFHILPNLLKKKELSEEFQLRYEMLPFHICSCLATIGQSELFCVQYCMLNVPALRLCHVTLSQKNIYISNACNIYEFMINFSCYFTNN
jgi:hypothetical protein